MWLVYLHLCTKLLQLMRPIPSAPLVLAACKTWPIELASDDATTRNDSWLAHSRIWKCMGLQFWV